MAAVDGGRWAVDGGRWTVDGGRWAADGEQGHKISCRGRSLFSGLFRFFRFRKCGSAAKRSLMYSSSRVFRVPEPQHDPWCAAPPSRATMIQTDADKQDGVVTESGEG